MLKEYGMEHNKAIATPLETNFQVVCLETDQIDQREYQSAIGALMYLAVTSRPDVLHSKRTATHIKNTYRH